jgi:heat shock protein HtpX
LQYIADVCAFATWGLAVSVIILWTGSPWAGVLAAIVPAGVCVLLDYRHPKLPDTVPVTDAPLPKAAVEGLISRARELGMRHLEVCFPTAEPDTPPAGALRTGRTGTILLSEGLENRLEPRQLRAVLFHELSHIARRDDLARAAVEFLGGTLSLLIPAAIVARHGDVLWMSDTLLFVGVLAITACGKALTLLASRWLSRRQEVRADRDAALWTGESGVLAGVREKLAATPFEEHR